MICSTSAGDGELPPWVFWYASMTSAAVAEVSGADALVPPAAQIGGGFEPWSMSAQPKNAVVLLLHSDQPRSPGATTSGRDVNDFYRAADRRKRHTRRLLAETSGAKYEEDR